MRHLAHEAMSTSEVPTAAPRSASRAIRRSAQPRRLLADVLWEAANVHLWDGTATGSGTPYSCHAVFNASDVWDYRDCNPIARFMRELGCEPTDASRFGVSREGEKRQGVRYMWLLLAMHVAEDEGITV